MQWPFISNRTYNRRADIHQPYGGQQQGGISTPAGAPAIFLFTGKSGRSHGYADHFNGDGSFTYTGEGQAGDMQMVRGNAAIRDHAKNGKDLLVFETLGHGKPVKFIGVFGCAGWQVVEQPDGKGTRRNAIVFALMPVGEIEDALAEAMPSVPTSSLPIEQMRAEAIAAATVTAQEARSSVTSIFVRSKAVRDYVLARAAGRCERCKSPAPFLTTNGTPYLEAHHIRRLTDGGPDHPSFVAAVCPNCHREAHHGSDSAIVNGELQALVTAAEARPPHQ